MIIITILGTINGLHLNAVRLKSKFTPKIYGRKSSVKSSPYYVSLQNIEQIPNGFNFSQHICGGAIINNRWILTAAHCKSLLLPNSSAIVVGAGNPGDNGIVHHYNEIIVHHSFEPKSSIGNIALAKTQNGIDFSENIQPVHLYTKYFDEDIEGIIYGFESRKVCLIEFSCFI